MITLSTVILLFHALDQARVSPYPVLPSSTDASICAFNSPHLVYFDNKAQSRHQLLVFLPGTYTKPGGTGFFCQTAAKSSLL